MLNSLGKVSDKKIKKKPKIKKKKTSLRKPEEKREKVIKDVSIHV